MDNLAIWIPMMVAPLTFIAIYELFWSGSPSAMRQVDQNERHSVVAPQDNRNITREFGFK